METRRVLVLVAALALAFGAVTVAAPEASACIQVYPWSALCGDPVNGAKKVACWETEGAVCVP